uniref:Sialin n=1 Tax=Cupiennius salei TaxID=6928 RepID=A0A061QFW8_CUPSA
MMDDSSSQEMPKQSTFNGMRYLFTLMGFFGYFTVYAVRVNINVAIVAMVNSTAVYHPSESSSGECKVDTPSFLSNDSAYDPPADGEFVWSPNMQGVILGAFYYGYCITQIPGGRLSEMYSAKWVYGIGTFITALLTLVTPLAARWHVGALIFIRAMEGLAQGVTMPAMYSLMGRWLPDCEKGLLSAIIYCGINMGTVVTMPLAGLLCRSDFMGGWPSAFYVVGIFGCVWFVAWCLLVTDSPVNHPYITAKELKYITSNQKIEQNVELPPIPWLKILKSVPFWGLLITQIGNDWAFYTIVNDLPTFFGTILHIQVEKNGFLSSFPYLLQTAVGTLVAYVTDKMMRKGLTTTNFVRKFCNTVSSVGTAAGLIGVCLAGCDVRLHVAFFTSSLALGGFCTCGYMLSHLDLSPEYAGTLMGIANTVSNLSGFLAPQVVGSLTEESQTLHQWHIVFAISIVMMLTTSVVFIAFVTTEKQPWATQEPQYTVLEQTEPLQIQHKYGTMDKGDV